MIFVVIISISIDIVMIMSKRNDTAQTGKSFPPRCEERPDCGSTKVESDCLCSGEYYQDYDGDDDSGDEDDNDGGDQ